MIENPEIVEVSEQHAAVLRLTIPRSEIQQVMAPAIGEVIATVFSQGLAPTGPIFTYHFRVDPEVFDFNVGVPVASPIAPTGRVTAGKLPAVRAARAIYQGPYERLGSAWGELCEWISSQGLSAAKEAWESYVVGPESSSDPASWRTELYRPLIG